jgi:hypothetical protein
MHPHTRSLDVSISSGNPFPVLPHWRGCCRRNIAWFGAYADREHVTARWTAWLCSSLTDMVTRPVRVGVQLQPQHADL